MNKGWLVSLRAEEYRIPILHWDEDRCSKIITIPQDRFERDNSSSHQSYKIFESIAGNNPRINSKYWVLCKGTKLVLRRGDSESENYLVNEDVVVESIPPDEGMFSFQVKISDLQPE